MTAVTRAATVAALAAVLAGCSSGVTVTGPPSRPAVTATVTLQPPTASVSTPTPPPASSSATRPPAPVHTRRDVRAELVAWWGDAETDYDAVTRDYRAVSDAAGQGDMQAISAACDSMIVHAHRFANNDLPAPDPAVSRALSRAMTLTVQSGDDCLRGDFEGAAAAIEGANRWTNRAVARIKALS